MTPEELSIRSGISVDEVTFAQFHRLIDLVRKWNSHINLVGRTTLDDLWVRHVVDSIQLYRFSQVRNDHFLDLGSGGGFPGLPLALLFRRDQPDCRVTLVESDQRKATFLREAARELGLVLFVRDERIEALPPMKASLITARALGPLKQLLGFAFPNLAPHGYCLFPKGKGFAEELAEAGRAWSFDVEVLESLSDPNGRIVRASAIRLLGG